MFIQGNLQALFDALYEIGAIDPVLKMDWQSVSRDMKSNPALLSQVIQDVNACRGNISEIVEILRSFDQKSVTYIALEVAREFAEFQDRKCMH
jgi:hypothetical protein